MVCGYCGKKSGSTGNVEGMIICSDCYYHMFGKSMFPESYDRYWSDGDIVVWIKDEKINHAWKDNGSTLIPLSIVEDLGIVAAIKKLIKLKDKTFCVSCSLEINGKPNRHFAGVYCNTCWEKYRSNNKSICSICRKPYYECHC